MDVALSAPAEAAVASNRYSFKSVTIGGTGFVTGVVFSQAQKDLAYARTDVGGMYRWNGGTGAWTPLLDWVSWDHWGYMGVAGIAASPSDADKVWAAVGMYTNGVDPNNGAVLRSCDKGRTWQVSVLPFTLGGNMNGGSPEALTGDPDIYGRVYLTGYGRGIIYGDPAGYGPPR